jgi:hypothetical protein
MVDVNDVAPTALGDDPRAVSLVTLPQTAPENVRQR